MLAFTVGDPASASASRSDIVVPGSVTFPGVRTSPVTSTLRALNWSTSMRTCGFLMNPARSSDAILVCASASDKPASGTRER